MLTPKATCSMYSFHIPIRLIGLEKGIPSTIGDSQEADYIVLIIQDGAGMLHQDDRSFPVSRGSVFVSGSTIPDLRLESNRVTPLRGIYIEYRCLPISGSTSYGLDCSAPFHAISPETLRLAGEFESLWRGQNSDEPFHMQLLFIKLLQEIHAEMEIRASSSTKQPWVEQALEYIDKNYHQDVTREHMTALSGVSPEHFSRMFRKHTGRTFNTYLTLLRIRKAQERVLTGSQDLNALAQEVGYKEGLYLSRKFKESVGVSPTVYKRKTKRITALNLNHTASLLALGIIPELGVYTPWLLQTQYNKNLSTGRHFDPYTLATDGYYEAVASSSPDLIISYNSAAENKRMLSLAPVLELPFKTMSWREQFRFIACTMNKQTAAEDWLSCYDELADRVNGELNHVLGERGTAVVWEICTDKAYCISGSFGRGSQILYDDIGFRPPERLIEEGLFRDGFVEVDIGEIASYAADHIFITSLPSDPSGQERVNVLFRSEEWMNLDAVRRNQVYVLNQPELFFGYDPISSEAQLHELMKVLRRHHKFA